MDLFCVPIEFELDLPSLYWIPKLFLTNNVILLGLPNDPRNLFPNYSHPFDQRLKQGFRVTVSLATQGVMLIRCGTKNYKRSFRVHIIKVPLLLQ
jgi:hypothetical protein